MPELAEVEVIKEYCQAACINQVFSLFVAVARISKSRTSIANVKSFSQSPVPKQTMIDNYFTRIESIVHATDSSKFPILFD